MKELKEMLGLEDEYNLIFNKMKRLEELVDSQ